MNKNKVATIFAAILLVSSIVFMIGITEAQEPEIQPAGGIPLPTGVTPSYEVTTYAYLSVTPNPIGVGQEALVNVFTTPAIHRARHHRDFKITITAPDGTGEVHMRDSYQADGTSWLTFTPHQTGTWTLKFEFPGNYFPPGLYWDYPTSTYVELNDNLYYKPSSTPETLLTVQDEPVSSWPASPLPTDYWIRPIPLEHREWWTIAGNFPWRGPGGGSQWYELHPDTNPYWSARQQFIPWTVGPNSPHVAWKQQHDLNAGILGGDLMDVAIVGSATNPSILYNGMGFWTRTKVVNGEPQSVWECFDIRTGELIWQRTGVTQIPTVIEYDIGTLAVPGVLPKPARPDFVYLGGGRLIKYNPNTGAVTLNVSIAPMTGSGGTYYMNGHVLGVRDLGVAAGAERYRLINWTIQPSTTDFTQRIISNITFAWSNLGTDQDFNLGYAALTTGGWQYGTEISVASLTTGQELWRKETWEPMYMGGCTKVDHGKVAVLMRGGYYKAWDLRTGNEAWTSEKMLYPWGETSWASYSVASGYGMLYQQTNEGIYAFDWDTGKIVWRYEDRTEYPFESRFTGEEGASVYPLYNFGAGLRIADGKVYATNSRHSPEMPLDRGYGTHAIDAFTGERIWRVSIRQSGFGTASVGQVHDGYFSVAAGDGYLYMFGKGQSETAVTVPSMAVQVGQSFTITGTVLDLSPAQPRTPAISDEDMAAWMEYLHGQMPKPTDAKGVTVKLATIDPNANLIEIGEATSDSNGVFGFTWAPEVPGLYQIIASFEGSESYGSSTASTYLTAIEAPKPVPDPTPPPESIADAYLVPGIVGIIVAIAIVGAVIVFMLRKR
jgi:hypothetical protein